MTTPPRMIRSPRASFWIIVAAQLAAGLVLGFLLALAGSTLGAWYAGSAITETQIEVGGVLGAVVAYPLGVALGVGLAGHLLGSPGAWWAATLGSVVGCGGVLLAASLGFQRPIGLIWGLFVFLGLAASTAGYTCSSAGRASRRNA